MSCNIYGLEMIVNLHTSHNTHPPLYHMNNETDFIALKYKNWMVGHMINSYRGDSLFIGVYKPISEKISLGVIFSNGYRTRIEVYKEGELFGWYNEEYVIRNKYKIIPMLNYRFNENIIISTNGIVNTVNYIFEI